MPAGSRSTSSRRRMVEIIRTLGCSSIRASRCTGTANGCRSTAAATKRSSVSANRRRRSDRDQFTCPDGDRGGMDVPEPGQHDVVVDLIPLPREHPAGDSKPEHPCQRQRRHRLRQPGLDAMDAVTPGQGHHRQGSQRRRTGQRGPDRSLARDTPTVSSDGVIPSYIDPQTGVLEHEYLKPGSRYPQIVDYVPITPRRRLSLPGKDGMQP